MIQLLNSEEKKYYVIRIAGLLLVSFFIMFSYSISRPASESLFLKAHTSKSLSYVWLLTAFFIVIAVSFYNRFVIRHDLLKLIAYSSLISAILLIVILTLIKFKTFGIFYALYIWKDIYIILLVEIFNSFSNVTFPIKIARWVYGMFGLFGTFGSITGNILVGYLAKKYGTYYSLFLVVPNIFIHQEYIWDKNVAYYVRNVT
jgi:AAA family ATP:ADP antiporter